MLVLCPLKAINIFVYQELLLPCHRHPWPGMDNTWTAIFHIAKASSGPPIPEGISEVVNDFLSRCFQLDPKKRPTSSEVRSIILSYLCWSLFYCFIILLYDCCEIVKYIFKLEDC